MPVWGNVYADCWMLTAAAAIVLNCYLTAAAQTLYPSINVTLSFDNETLLLWTRMNLTKSATLQEIQERQRTNRSHIIFWFQITLLAYVLVSVVWIAFNIVYYKRQKRRMKIKSKLEEENAYKAVERERLLKIYQEIPSLQMAANNSFSNPSNAGRQLDSRIDGVQTDFQLNRAKVEATLRFKPPPKFLSRI